MHVLYLDLFIIEIKFQIFFFNKKKYVFSFFIFIVGSTSLHFNLFFIQFSMLFNYRIPNIISAADTKYAEKNNS